MSTDQPMPDAGQEASAPLEESRESPLHGFRGKQVSAHPVVIPASLTIAVSREAGSRGSSIAGRAGQKLGWQVYNQELLEYIAHETDFRQDLMNNLSPAASGWVEERLEALRHEQNLSQHPSITSLARVILALGAQGEAIVIGRGAGCILPPASTLHVRIMAPLADRIAYMSQWLRMTVEEAAEQVRARDHRRREFIAAHFHRQAGDCYQYDVLINSSLLGEDLCAELIAQAAKAKLAARQPPSP